MRHGPLTGLKIIEFAGIAGYKRLCSYKFVDDIGRNALGKLNKRALR